MSDLIFNTTRQIVTTTRGEELPIKEHRGWKYVNYNGYKVGINNLPKEAQNEDPVYNYIFNKGFIRYPCPAMEYWIYRHRLKNRITTKDYKMKFGVKLKKTK